MHRQVGMQVSSFVIKKKKLKKERKKPPTVNSPYTYNCDELYMASPLEKESRELEVLIITQNIGYPVFVP